MKKYFITERFISNYLEFNLHLIAEANDEKEVLKKYRDTYCIEEDGDEYENVIENDDGFVIRLESAKEISDEDYSVLKKYLIEI